MRSVLSILAILISLQAWTAIANESAIRIPRSMPGDKGQYFVLDKKKTGSTIRVTHKRVGPSGITYTLTEVNCKTRLMRVLGDGEELPIRKHKPTKWFEFVPGSSKSDLANFLCK